MIKPSDIKINGNKAELRIEVCNGDPDSMRKLIWNHIFEELQWELAKAVQHKESKWSEKYPGYPESFDKVFDMIRFDQ